MRRKLLVEMDVVTNIESLSEMRGVLREGLDHMFITRTNAVKDSTQVIEIVDVGAIDTEEKD